MRLIIEIEINVLQLKSFSVPLLPLLNGLPVECGQILIYLLVNVVSVSGYLAVESALDLWLWSFQDHCKQVAEDLFGVCGHVVVAQKAAPHVPHTLKEISEPFVACRLFSNFRGNDVQGRADEVGDSVFDFVQSFTELELLDHRVVDFH